MSQQNVTIKDRVACFFAGWQPIFFGLLLIAPALFLSGCSADRSVQLAPSYIHPELQKIGELSPYKIQVGDIIEVKFMYNDEFNQEIIVRPDGMISTAAVKAIKAVGKTPSELSDDLIDEYEVHLKDPQLSVLVKSYAPTRIYVLGEVRSPGEYTSLSPNPSLMQTLARAGDIQNSAESDQILIIRKNDVNEPTFYLASYEQATKNPLADIQLTSNDVVFVPKTAIADVYEAYDQYIRQFIPTSLGFGYSLNPDND